MSALSISAIENVIFGKGTTTGTGEFKSVKLRTIFSLLWVEKSRLALCLCHNRKGTVADYCINVEYSEKRINCIYSSEFVFLVWSLSVLL